MVLASNGVKSSIRLIACCWLSLLVLAHGGRLGPAGTTAATTIVPSPALLQSLGGEAAALCAAARASACGDPHFKGFDGTPFEFGGQEGKCYNLISERDHQVNAQFITESATRPGSPTAGTWMGAIVIKFRGDVLQIKAVGDGKLSVRLNQAPLIGPPGSPEVRRSLASGLRLALHQHTAHPAAATTTTSSSSSSEQVERLVVVTPDMSLAVRASSPGQQHLDFLVLAISPYLCDIHGVLGQTYRRMTASGPGAAHGQAPFTLEGADWDYELPQLLSDSFIFNRFQRADGGGCAGRRKSGGGSSGGSRPGSSGGKAVPGGSRGSGGFGAGLVVEAE